MKKNPEEKNVSTASGEKKAEGASAKPVPSVSASVSPSPSVSQSQNQERPERQSENLQERRPFDRPVMKIRWGI
ncbi:hypothetical protein HYX13_03235, partial [Candidatus Woesearchaeota archaeon]|nr:hypothetical protein [Candidatus Woesearchaeota archaeon]